MNTKQHWETVYENKTPDQVSWTQEKPEISLKLILETGVSKSAQIIDVGGGDSKLVDYLLEEGFKNVSVLDISEKALEKAKKRLGDQAAHVTWIVDDITAFKPQKTYDVWHDRATFHFLTTDAEIKYYKKITSAFVKDHLIIGTFSKDGPTKCSGLPIAQYDDKTLLKVFAKHFEKVICLRAEHITPFETIQNFQFCRFKKILQCELIASISQQKMEINVSIKLKQESQRFTQLLFNALFDIETDAESTLIELEQLFLTIRDIACPEIKGEPCKTWDDFKLFIPDLFFKLKKDALAIFNNDPAAKSIEEVYLAYPGFFAIAIYRMAREFFKLGLPLIPRLMTEYAHQLTGIDIHPGADIGESFFIDHGTGVVIGETAEIHNNVKIYQGVTLGALTVKKKLKNKKRHPTIQNNVIIYANATILGGKTIIGKDSVIGGNTWITSSLAPNSTVLHTPKVEIIAKQKKENE